MVTNITGRRLKNSIIVRLGASMRVRLKLEEAGTSYNFTRVPV